MNKDYCLLKSKSKEFDYICIALNNKRLDEYLNFLEIDLKNMIGNKTVSVLIDLKRANPSPNQRFFRSEIKMGVFQYMRFENVSANVNNLALIECGNFHNKNKSN